MPLKASKPTKGARASQIPTSSDPRFDTRSDPRYKFPSKDKTKLKLDDRFNSVKKSLQPTVVRDQWGRKVKTDKSKALKNLYKLADEEEEDNQDEDSDADEPEEKATSDGADDDDVVQKELHRIDKNYDPARGGGFSSSSEDSDSDPSSDDEDENDDGEAELPAGASMSRMQDEEADVELGEVTNRIAIVNLDWDHIKAVDLLSVFSSFTPATGRIERVIIYPSEFGKERMQREEMEGPPKELFQGEKKDKESKKKKKQVSTRNKAQRIGLADSDESESDSDAEIKKGLIQEGDDRDFDTVALRTYQLDRLRYYYAVMVVSDKATAKEIYDATDGREYLSSSNFIDLRFIPDDVTFDDEPHDEADHIPTTYKPVEFVTDALQHSKVKLTWDMHPEEAARKDSIKRAFAGSKNDLLENDLKAYLASDSEDDDAASAVHQPGDLEEGDKPLSKKELARRKLREKLGLGDESLVKDNDSGPVGAMTVTFKSALMGDEEVPKKKEAEEETSLEKYKRKERERKERKLAKRQANHQVAATGDSSDVVAGESDVEIVDGPIGDDAEGDLGFDDPFFSSTPVEKKSRAALRKEERLKKREEREAEEAERQAEIEMLQHALGKPQGGDERGFNMKAVMSAEKAKGKKGKKGKQAKKLAAVAAEAGEDFELKVDERFERSMGADAKWAIDPSQPEFQKTGAMKKLMEQKGRKRKTVENEEEMVADAGSKKKRKKEKEKKMAEKNGEEWRRLADKVKMKVAKKR